MKINKLYLILIMFLGAVLRLFQISQRPLDGDEGIILKIANNSFAEVINQAAKDVHPPLFHLMTKPIINWLGVHEWSGRLLPAILGVVLVYLVYQFARQLFDHHKKISIAAALLTGISCYLIYPSQEIRMYMLFAVLATSSYYYFWLLAQNVSNNKLPKCNHWIIYIIFSTLLIYTQYLGCVVLFSQLCYLIFLGFKSKFPIYQKTYLKWISSGILILVLFTPQLGTMLMQFTSRVTEQSQSISIAANIKGLVGAFYRFGSGRLFLDLNLSAIKTLLVDNPWVFLGFLISLIVPLVLFIQGLRIAYQKYSSQFWFLISPIIMAMLLAIFSAEVGGRASRYLIYIFPFYIIFVSLASSDYLKSRWWRLWPIAFVLINLVGLYQHYQVENKAPGVNNIANYIYQNHQPGDIILIRGGFGGGEEYIFNYYWQQLAISHAYRQAGDQPLAVYDMLGSYQAGNLVQLKAVNPQDQANLLLETYQRVWFYDLTYSNYQIDGTKHNLGKDKEQKDLILWEMKN